MGSNEILREKMFMNGMETTDMKVKEILAKNTLFFLKGKILDLCESGSWGLRNCKFYHGILTYLGLFLINLFPWKGL